jgi:putative pyruvate formate lyase activating enzyme
VDERPESPEPVFTPAYLSIYRRGELQPRLQEALVALENCSLCPRACGAERTHGKTGTCQTRRYARVASFFPHFGEEAPLRGWRGAVCLSVTW